MPPSHRVAISLNLSSNAPIQTISSVLADLSTVCEFGGKLQAEASRSQALLGIARNPEQWLSQLPNAYGR